MSADYSQECWETSMEVMQIIPHNRIARLLFARCLEYAKSIDVEDKHFAKFVVTLPIADVLNAKSIESETDYDSAPQSDLEEQSREGYYNISLAEELQPEMVQLGWRIGKGRSSVDEKHRGVDIILAKPGDLLGKTLPGVVCRLFLDKQLGILAVQRPDRSKGDVQIKLESSWEVFAAGEDRPLYRKSSWLRAGHCEYEFRYTIQLSQREQFLAQRDQILDSADDFVVQTAPSGTKNRIAQICLPTLTYVPGDPIWSNSIYVRLGTIAKGAFGYIYEGFTINSCQRIAIKELRLGTTSDCRTLLSELRITRELQSCRGIISCLEYHCEHGNAEPCRTPENFYICYPQAIHDFSRFDWFRGYTLEMRLQLLWQVLWGLHEMHEKDMMHRDVSVANLLILSYDPPQAVVTDFGKAIHAHSSYETTIGPISTLAPEVWSATVHEPYNKAIDVWAYGHAIAKILRCVGTHHDKITKEEHSGILKNLDDHKKKYYEEAHLVDLTKSMLTWDFHQRITIQLALDHQCWHSINIQGSKRSAGGAELELSEQQIETSVSGRINYGAISQTQAFGSQTQELLAKNRYSD